MARVVLKRESFVNGAAAHHHHTQSEVRQLAKRVESRAQGNLARARASGVGKIADPEHLTEIGASKSVGKYGALDYIVFMEGYKGGAMAIEFGHAPSGVFGPGGKLADVDSKAPQGLYILSRAAFMDGPTMVPGGRKSNLRQGRKRGKR